MEIKIIQSLDKTLTHFSLIPAMLGLLSRSKSFFVWVLKYLDTHTLIHAGTWSTLKKTLTLTAS